LCKYKEISKITIGMMEDLGYEVEYGKGDDKYNIKI
jgi:hypothetical protein